MPIHVLREELSPLICKLLLGSPIVGGHVTVVRVVSPARIAIARPFEAPCLDVISV